MLFAEFLPLFTYSLLGLTELLAPLGQKLYLFFNVSQVKPGAQKMLNKCVNDTSGRNVCKIFWVDLNNPFLPVLLCSLEKYLFYTYVNHLFLRPFSILL